MPSDLPERHPVWDVYDLLRTARFNEIYYARRMVPLKRWQRFFEIAIATTAPSSAVAGLVWWENPLGRFAWQTLVAIAAIAALLQPIIRLTERLQVHQVVVTQYRDLKIELQSLRNRISQQKAYSDEHAQRYMELDERRRGVARSEPTHQAVKKLRDAAFAEVNREMPKDEFFIPGD